MDSVAGVRCSDAVAAAGRTQGREIVVRYPGIAITLAALWAGLTPGVVPAQSRLTVEVKNSTANGASVVGDEVTLQLYKGREPTNSLQAKVGEDGKAVFESVPAGPDMVALPRAKHQNMAFHGQPLALNSAGRELSASVQVFDVSTDTSKLSAGTHHLMVAARGGVLEFTEYMQLNNSSDKAVTGARRDAQNQPIVIEVKLPQGFQDLKASSYFESQALVVTAEGFYDTMAVPPGEHQVTFSYRIPINRGTMEIVKEITLPTAELMIFWEHGQGRLEGLGDPNGRLTNAEGAPLEYYQRSALQPGDRIAFRIAGFAVQKSDSYTWIVLAIVFAVIVVIALLRLRPRPAEAGQQHA